MAADVTRNRMRRYPGHHAGCSRVRAIYLTVHQRSCLISLCTPDAKLDTRADRSVQRRNTQQEEARNAAIVDVCVCVV